jgi:hypothetical protein
LVTRIVSKNNISTGGSQWKSSQTLAVPKNTSKNSFRSVTIGIVWLGCGCEKAVVDVKKTAVSCEKKLLWAVK